MPAADRRSAARAEASVTAVVWPSASSVSVATPSRIVASYVLSSPTMKVSRRVAPSTPSTSRPVAIGSRVPACPILRVPSARRARATTSWLVIPPGLSTSRMPGLTAPSAEVLEDALRMLQVGVVDDRRMPPRAGSRRAGRAPAPPGSGRWRRARKSGSVPSRSAIRGKATSTGTSSHTDQSQSPRSSGRCRKMPSTISTASRGAVTHADSTGASRARSNAASWNPVVAAVWRPSRKGSIRTRRKVA